MKQLLFLAIIGIVSITSKSQTVIEMLNPSDANTILLVVDDINEADLVVYKTEDQKEADQWDCQWRFKQWGFSNLSVYLAKTENDSLLIDEDEGDKIKINGKIFFTDDPSKRGYKDPNFRIQGVFRKVDKKDVNW